VPTTPDQRRQKRVKPTPFFVTRPEKRTFRLNNKLAWNTYWDLVWNRGRIKVPNPNERTRGKYPKISIGYLMHHDPGLRHRVMEDYRRWRELNVDGMLVAKNPHGLHAGVHVHLEAPQINPEVSGLHKGDRYYGVIEDVGTGAFEVQLYDVRNGKPLRKMTVPRAKFEEYEARYHPQADSTKTPEARVARRWLVTSARSCHP